MKPGTAHTMWEAVDHTPQESIFNSFYYFVKNGSHDAVRKPVYETIWNNILRPVQTQVKHAAWYSIQDFIDENFPSLIRATPPLTASIYFLPLCKCAEVYTHVVGAVEEISTPGFRTQMWMIMGRPSFMRQLINHTIEAELNKYE